MTTLEQLEQSVRAVLIGTNAPPPELGNEAHSARRRLQDAASSIDALRMELQVRVAGLERGAELRQKVTACETTAAQLQRISRDLADIEHRFSTINIAEVARELSQRSN